MTSVAKTMWVDNCPLKSIVSALRFDQTAKSSIQTQFIKASKQLQLAQQQWNIRPTRNWCDWQKKEHEIVIYELNFFSFFVRFRPENKNQTNYFLVNDFGVSFELWPEMLTFPKKRHMSSPLVSSSHKQFVFCGFLF